MKRFLLVASTVLLVACNRTIPSPPLIDVDRLLAEARLGLAEHDWNKAVQAFTAALASEPSNLAGRYGLGVALSQLDRADEARVVFTWVVAHGPADREEVRLARQWLTDNAAEPTREVTIPTAAVQAGGVDRGLVEGATQWLDLNADDARPTLQILLVGDDGATRDKRYGVRVPLNERYRIESVVPGYYRLLAQVGSVRLWETTVAVRSGQSTVVDLTPAVSTARPDALHRSGS